MKLPCISIEGGASSQVTGSPRQSTPPQLYFPSWKKPPKGDNDFDIKSIEGNSTKASSYGYWWKSYRAVYDEMINRSGFSPGAPVFWSSFWGVSQSIVFLDLHLDLSNIRRILQALSERDRPQDGNQITAIMISLFENRQDMAIGSLFREADAKWKRTEIAAFKLSREDKLVHDRFALVDNNIWHFGAKIAAMHRELNAFSGPWEDEDNSMREVLLEILDDSICIYPSSRPRGRDLLPVTGSPPSKP